MLLVVTSEILGCLLLLLASTQQAGRQAGRQARPISRASTLSLLSCFIRSSAIASLPQRFAGPVRSRAVLFNSGTIKAKPKQLCDT